MLIKKLFFRAVLYARNFQTYSNNSKNYIDISLNKGIGIATVTMNRPPVNSINMEFLQQFSETLTKLENEKVKGLILTSFFDKVFSAGLDFIELYKPNPEHLRKFIYKLAEVMSQLYESSFPTVAVINGHAPAGGCVLAICCDYRIMINDFKIGLSETAVGIIAPYFIMSLMMETIGKRQGELALTSGRLFKTDQALKIGLVDENISNKTEGLQRATVFLNNLFTVNSASRTITKKSLRSHIFKDTSQTDEAINQFVSFTLRPETQASLEKYIKTIKKTKLQK